MGSAMTWGQVHVGDTVRGADQRVWVVCYRHAGPDWVISGKTAHFVLRLGEREVSVHRRHDEPVAIVQAANHQPEATAVGALLETGLVVEVMEESMPTEQPAAPAVRAAEPRRDRYGRYLLPDPTTGKERAWTRVSTIARTLADEYALSRWGERMTAKGLALRPDLIAGAAAADVDTDKGTLDSIVKQAKERAGSTAGANMGTAFHTFAQRLDGGEARALEEAPAPLGADLKAYTEMLHAARLEVIPALMERIVLIPELGAAGTLDRIVQLRGRTGEVNRQLSIMDLKSGKMVSFGWLEYAIQQAMYARATYMWDATSGAYSEMPAVHQDRALIAHVPIGKAHAQLYGVDIIKGWTAAMIAANVREMRTECAAGRWSWLVEPDDKAALALHNVSRAASREELSALWERLHPAGLWSEEINSAAAARWEAIKEGVPA